jgi:hypothetical protein
VSAKAKDNEVVWFHRHPAPVGDRNRVALHSIILKPASGKVQFWTGPRAIKPPGKSIFRQSFPMRDNQPEK